MPILRRSAQMLTYVRQRDRDEFDLAAAELEVSRADLMRQCVLDYLEQRRNAADLVAAAGDVVLVDELAEAGVWQVHRSDDID